MYCKRFGNICIICGKIQIMSKIIETTNAPAPIGPYSQAVLAGNTLYVSGQIALNPESGEIENESLEAETHRVMKNMLAVLKAAKYTIDDILYHWIGLWSS